MSDAAERAARQIWPDDQRSMTLGSEDAIDNKQQYFARLIRAEYQELVDAAAEFTDYYRPAIARRLGNGQAYKSCNRIRAALKKVSP